MTRIASATFLRSAAPIIGMRPRPSPISFIFSRTSFASGILVGTNSTASGRVLRSFCTTDVASASGGVKVSSIVSLMPSFSNPPSRIGFRKLTGDAVLSPMMPIVCNCWPVATFPSSMIAGMAPIDCAPAVGDVWNTYLKPRAVI
jgi:hypothetical protein